MAGDHRDRVAGRRMGPSLDGLPRISLYGLVGFIFANAQWGVLAPAGDGPMVLLANMAFGLILFEFGYRINLHWLRRNPWIPATGLLEAAVTFGAVYAMSRIFGLPTLTALLLASLSMSTSPAAVMHVINEQRTSGQVTERVLHLSAINCVLAVLTVQCAHRACDLQAVTLALNTRPRKTLGWRTPAEALNEMLRSAGKRSVATTR